MNELEQVEEIRKRANEKAQEINERHYALQDRIAKRVQGRTLWTEQMEYFLKEMRQIEQELHECSTQLEVCRSIDGKPNDPSKYRKEA